MTTAPSTYATAIAIYVRHADDVRTKSPLPRNVFVPPAKNGAPPNYSVSVQPEGGTAQTIAHNYAFRTEQQNVQLLNNWTLEAEVGAGRARYVGMDTN